MNPTTPTCLFAPSRRSILRSASCGFGYLALAGLCGQAARAGGGTRAPGGAAPVPGGYLSPLAPKRPPLPARAKRVIFLFMRGGPSHIDSFDYKPELARYDGKTFDAGKLPEGAKGKVDAPLLASPFKFSRHGKSGLPISDAFPRLAEHADKLCLINGMHHKTPIHLQGTVMMHTGSFQFVRPSAGSWVVYGLGAETTDLPGYVVLNPLRETMASYQSAFLPQAFTATPITLRGSAGEVVPNVHNSRLTPAEQRRQLDLIQAMNGRLAAASPGASELDAVIESYERGFKMQQGVPRAMDLSGESPATLEMYGIKGAGKGGGGAKGGGGDFAMQCLLARRLAEQGVRFIEVTRNGWDHHGNIAKAMAGAASAVDGPIAALLTDLEQRGMLDETLVVWGGEFGRTPWRDSKGDAPGRNHNAAGFTYWLAGGGVKGGIRHGATDDTGAYAARDPVGVHDLHATILHQLGLDHWNLTYRYGGREYRLTDVDGKVVKAILA